ncbi:hypothetical protein F7R91_25805 [Streptomyces luteolifulvus]|uniref:Integrin-like protein n=1 Tax=Streptomyces luteolifulvus TaxID=2615112 RepID=A0A6H9UU95_9ACTN|nr:hypothetical protein F7R91_25805 [Streptomyces luteolifulvus]
MGDRPVTYRRLAVLLAASLAPLTLSGPAAHAVTAAAPYDFNGDGRADVAIGAPAATVAGKSQAGAVSVVYGSASGLRSSTHTLITQNTAGIPGSAETGDAFGTSVASADLNTDGYADLLIGAPGEDGNDTNDGTVVIVWGSKSGLSGARTLPNWFYRDQDRFGQSLAAGDLDDDGDTDVAVGTTGPNNLTFVQGPITKSGALNSGSGASFEWGASHSWSDAYGITHLSAGDVTGQGFDSLVVHGRVAGTDDTITALADGRISNYTDWLQRLPDGHVSAIGDIDGDGHADIAVGNPRETSADPSGAKGGKVTVVYGGPDGVDITRARLVLTQDTAGVPGAAETGDGFGGGLSLGDINGDGHADLAIGSSGETSGSATAAGAVTVLYGSASGLNTQGARTYTQNTTGVPGTAEKNDHFGARVVLADQSGDHRADLTVGGPGENAGDGAVWSLRGTATGVTTTGSTTFGPPTTGVATTGSPKYGATLGG